MLLIDSHAHLNFNAYKNDADKVVSRSLADNVWIINVGSQFSTSERAVKIAQKYGQGVYAAVGLHPIHLSEGIFKRKIDPSEEPNGIEGARKEKIEFKTKEEEFNYQKYKNLAKSPKVVAIGETGFDYYFRPKTKKKLSEFKERQKQVFLKHLELAKELGLPLIFHCRFAHQELIETFEEQKSKFSLQGVVHCFTGNQEEAERYLKMGFYLGFNGIIFKLNLDKIIKKTPLERILIETDCPYLTPPQESGRNEPLYVKHITQRIAQIKNLTFEQVARATAKNAKNLFNLK